MSLFLEGVERIYGAARRSEDGQRCCVPPSPKLQQKMRQEIEAIRSRSTSPFAKSIGFRGLKRVGFNDGMIVPGDQLPLGAPPSVARAVAMKRAPSMKKTLRIVVVLVEFSDKRFRAGGKQYFEDLFFSTHKVATGSVKEYYADVTGKKVDIQGEVSGPYLLPKTLAEYAGGGSGIDNGLPNARTMAHDAAVLADPQVDFKKFDNDGDGFVDAYVVVHAGSGAEETGSSGDIWSHKWVLSGGELSVDGSKVYSYLTEEKPTFFILIDNLRYDQWKMIEPYFEELLDKREEEAFFRYKTL